jgi:hypothetical protein
MGLFKRWFLPMGCGLIGLFCCQLCCQFSTQKRDVIPSFYYWKQFRAYDPAEADEYEEAQAFNTSDLQQLGVKRAYVKLFDIDWRVGNGAYPRQRFQTVAPLPTLDLVPTFYILNRVFEKSDSADIENLAAHIVKIVGVKYSEIQMDCDWTATTREAYFQYLRTLRQQLPPSVKISATIRLHQIKYRDKTGIPPVDRGMLMVYNVGNPTEFTEKNSIFDLEEAKKYLDGQTTYPLQLDVALPIFRWGIVYRSQKLLTVFNDFNANQADTTRFLTKNGRFYEVNKDTLYRKKYLRYGDKFKIEEINDELLRGAAELAAPLVRHTNPIHITYFHYDKSLVAALKSDTYAQVYKIFAR